MRLGIAAMMLVLVAACADQDPDPQPARQPTDVTLVSMTAAGGGQLGPELLPLDRKADVRRFLRPFDGRFQGRLRKAISAYDVPEGYNLFGGVAYVGCGEPDEAAVEGEGKNAHLVPGATHDENIECFAAVTTVGLVAMPAPRQ